jgi:tetratricopeptide (TPR) repeat protein
MKRFLFLTSVVALGLIMGSCNDLKKMAANADDINYSVNPKVLEVHNGQVAVNITGNFPEKYFRKKVSATLTPTLVWEGGEKALTPIYVEGEKVHGNAQVIKYKPGGAFSYNDKFDYSPEMRRSKLVLKITAVKGTKEAEFDPEDIAEGIVATPELVKMTGGKSSNAASNFKKDNAASKIAAINYDKNKAEIKSSETKKEEITEMQKYIKDSKDNDRIRFDGVELKSYASPEGTQDINKKVSNDRSNSATKFVKNELKGVNGADGSNFFKTLVTEEDWEGFKTAVQNSNLADKDMIIRVINMNSDPDKREEEIRNMKNTFDELEKEVLPSLRRSEIVINITEIGKTDEEIEKVYKEDPSKLSFTEIMHYGEITEDAAKRVEIFTKATELYPDEWSAYNNLGAALYETKDYQAAKVALEKAKSKSNGNATVLNNMGNVALSEGNVAEAESNYASATGVPEASAGQGVIAIKKAQYANASNFYGDDCSFNAGLAKVLNKENDAALKALDCGAEKEDAMNYYLKAVVCARKTDNEGVFNNLRTACQKDSSLKDFAAKDVEFINLFENETFKSIVK